MSQHRPLRRLPPLQVVGRKEVVDEDEPPEVIVSSDDEVACTAGRVYHYECGDGERVYAVGTDVWTRLQPGNHHAPRRDADGVFVHGRTAGQLGCKYRHLAALLHTRAKIRVAREIATRLAAIDSFMHNVKLVVRDEYTTWRRIADGGPMITTRLDCLPSICDDLHVHANQWSLLRHLVVNDANIRPFLAALRSQLDAVHARLDWLVRDALWWTRRLITVGLRVVAHCDSSQMHTDMLWSILRALEDFNLMARSLHPEITPIKLNAILKLIADERSTQAAAILHRCLAPKSSTATTACAPWWPSAESTDRVDSTSDYDSGSRSSTSHISVSQLTCHAPPILAFARAEHEYASRFLHVMSRATQLLPLVNSTRMQSGVKSVRWGDADEAVSIQRTADLYIDLLWSRSADRWLNMLSIPAWTHERHTPPGSVRTHATTLTLVHNIQHACLKDMLPTRSVQPLSLLARKLHAHASWAAWDEAFCASLASRVTDRGQSTLLADGQHCTHTAKLLRDAYTPLRSTLDMLGQPTLAPSSDSRTRPECDLLAATLSRLQSTADESAIWCQTKAFHLLAGCALTSFLLVTHSDLQLLTDEMELSLKACMYACPSHDRKEEPHVSVQCQRSWQRTNCTAAQCQSFSGMMVRMFSESCTTQATEFFREVMPVGRTWKLKCQSDWRPKPSAYMEEAVDTLIEPVVVGVSKLRSTAQLSIVSMAVTAFGRAWVRFILQQRIRFSWQGALQLEQDVLFLHDWLLSNLSGEDIRNSVAQLDILKYLHSAASLLKLQPSPPGGSTVTSTAQQKCCSIKSGTVYAADGVPPPIVNERNSTCNGSAIELEAYEIPNRDQWLALRVHGGAMMWPKFTSCFNLS